MICVRNKNCELQDLSEQYGVTRTSLCW
ncbi:MAG: hypothetical protein MZV64_20595 [Ignavibacteriales bacterium]|nr:hypothetical protein [Ignavibacteriales bacterium]